MVSVSYSKSVNCQTLTLTDSEWKLLIPERCNDILMKKVERLLSLIAVQEEQQDDLEFQLVVDCCKLLVDVEDEAIQIQNSIYHKYESLASYHDLLVNKIDPRGIEELTLVDLQGFLPRESISILQEATDASDRVLFLDDAKRKILEFLENRMDSIAPNLAAVVGIAVAAKLIGSAGGLEELAKFASSDLPWLGAERAIPAWLWSRGTDHNSLEQYQFGYLQESGIFQSVHHTLKKRVGKILCAKSILAARMDSGKGDPAGDYGRALMVAIWDKIDRWEEPLRQREPPFPDHIVTCRFEMENNMRYAEWKRRMEAMEAYLATQMSKDKRLLGQVSFWYKLQSSLTHQRKSKS